MEKRKTKNREKEKERKARKTLRKEINALLLIRLTLIEDCPADLDRLLDPWGNHTKTILKRTCT